MEGGVEKKRKVSGDYSGCERGKEDMMGNSGGEYDESTLYACMEMP
jgi:hypothetical protein